MSDADYYHWSAFAYAWNLIGWAAVTSDAGASEFHVSMLAVTAGWVAYDMGRSSHERSMDRLFPMTARSAS